MRHDKINRPQNPCEEDPEYDFVYCIEKSIVVKSGCKPYWSRFDMEEKPFCSNASMMQQYDNIINEVIKSVSKERHVITI